MLRTRLLPLLLSVWLLSLAACARDCTQQVSGGWIRMPPAGMPGSDMSMMAGFGRIENRCPRPLDIVSASSAAFGGVSIHETRIVDGVSRMRPVPRLTVAPEESALLAPGGLHLMLMQPHAPLQPGDKVVIEFVLEDGGVLAGEFRARRP